MRRIHGYFARHILPPPCAVEGTYEGGSSAVKGDKIYETADHDKGIATVEHPTSDTTRPKEVRETRSKVDSLDGLFGTHK